MWFKDDYIYGIHGKPSKDHEQFYATDRKTSQGCLVFPEVALTKLVDLIFSTPNFQNSEAVETIKQYRAVKRAKNIVIRLRDADTGDLSPLIGAPEEIGYPLAVDVKLVVINMAQWDSPVDVSQQVFVS